MNEDQPLTMNQLADHFQVTTRTVQRWVERGMPYLAPSGRVRRFLLSDVLDWMRRQEIAA